MPTNRKNATTQIGLPFAGNQRRARSKSANPKNPKRAERPGAVGERLAAEYLEDKGYSIVARNWRAPETRNEIDLIALDSACLVFVEVKTARSRNFGDPLTWIPPRKQRAIIKAAKAFIAAHRPANPELRFDAVAIAPPSREGERVLRHVIAAFTIDDSQRA